MTAGWFRGLAAMPPLPGSAPAVLTQWHSVCTIGTPCNNNMAEKIFSLDTFLGRFLLVFRIFRRYM